MTLSQHSHEPTDLVATLVGVAGSLAVPLDHGLVLIVVRTPTGLAATLRMSHLGAPGAEIGFFMCNNAAFELGQASAIQFSLWLGHAGLQVPLRYLATVRRWFGADIVEVGA
jgi:hypothetical protein